ncbi:hypothetical protein GJU40_07285 [Bacillus lacus]|uniref:Uncharacterized protein n=1 Tax=Metabacillus lacus TaxID=1983721 RepID=A0A7X2IY60_9BACI|nr:hypothetical protein [Metabacillus lacus]MRX71973.1 hypothetical protein [Metabacillus lacus]
MRDLVEKAGLLEKKIKSLSEQGEKEALIHITQEMSEILSTALSRFQSVTQKETDDNILSFIFRRLEAIKNDEAPIPLHPGGKAIIHIVPIHGVKDDLSLDVSILRDKSQQLPQLCQGGFNFRFNFDGFLTYNRTNHKSSYVQVFRNGCMEIVENGIFKSADKLIYISRFEEILIHVLPKYLKILKECKIWVPHFVYITLSGVKGYSLYHNTFLVAHEIEKDELRLPKVLLEESDDALEVSLKPAFDVLWNSVGIHGSLNYVEGTRIQRK